MESVRFARLATARRSPSRTSDEREASRIGQLE